MAKKLYEESDIQSIADAIREKNKTINTYKVSEMAGAIINIEGGAPTLQSKSVTYTSNGTATVTPDSGYDGLSSIDVTVNVSGGGGGVEIPTISVTLKFRNPPQYIDEETGETTYAFVQFSYLDPSDLSTCHVDSVYVENEQTTVNFNIVKGSILNIITEKNFKFIVESELSGVGGSQGLDAYSYTDGEFTTYECSTALEGYGTDVSIIINFIDI